MLSSLLIRNILSLFSKIKPEPIFILGNPKSGTTVITNLLSRSTKQTLTSDIKNIIMNPTLQLDFKLLCFDDFIKQHKYEFSKDIIKEPFLSFYSEELIKHYPNSKIF